MIINIENFHYHDETGALGTEETASEEERSAFFQAVRDKKKNMLLLKLLKEIQFGKNIQYFIVKHH